MKKIFFIFLLLIIFYSLFFVHFVLAGYKIEVDIPGGPAAGTPVTLTEYIRYIYLFGLSLVGVAALGALVYGGFTYMLSGTVTKKEEAMKYIWGAISGLVLGLAAYLILNTINPDLVSLKPPCSPDNCPTRCVIPCDTAAGYNWSSDKCQCFKEETGGAGAATAPPLTCTASQCDSGCEAAANCAEPTYIWAPTSCECVWNPPI